MIDKIIVNARFLTQRLTGVQRFAIELSLQLKRMLGDKVVFVSPYNIIQTEIAKSLDVEAIGRYTGYLWEQMELPKWLKRHGMPKLLNLCNVAPLYYRNNYVVIHDITWVRYPNAYSGIFRMLYNFMIQRLCHNAKHLFTVSEFSHFEISHFYGIPLKKISVVYNAVDSKFSPVIDEQLRSEHYFVAVSSLKENKNFPVVLKSFKRVQKRLPEVKLYIIGDLQDKNFKTVDLTEYMLNSQIRFLGRVSDEDLIRYYSNAIAFIFPSFYEGFGIPVLEAQACGCPVISSDCSSLPEVLHKSALYNSPLNIDGFTDKMIQLATDDVLRTDLIQQGFENIKRFSWENSAKKLLIFLSEIF